MNYPDRVAAVRGVEYLQSVQSLLPFGVKIDVMTNIRDREIIYTWIGKHIDRVNVQLQDYVNACHYCFHPIDRRKIDIFAVPLPQSCGLDGLCNLTMHPTTILVDVGRVPTPDWLRLVVHEYSHAHLGKPGHDRDFARILNHLCLGLGIEAPPDSSEEVLRHSPTYRSRLDPIAFWRGE